MGKKINRPEFYEDEYEALDNYGLKKGKVARIVNSSKRKSSKKGKNSVDLNTLSRKELLEKAEENGLPVSSRMGKKELIETLKTL